MGRVANAFKERADEGVPSVLRRLCGNALSAAKKHQSLVDIAVELVLARTPSNQRIGQMILVRSSSSVAFSMKAFRSMGRSSASSALRTGSTSDFSRAAVRH
jgi:hypothetical protein